MSSLLLLLLSAVVINVTVLSHVPTWRPFVEARGVFDASIGLAVASFIVLPVTALLDYVLMHVVLLPLELQYLETMGSVLLIMGVVAIVEALFRRWNRWLPARPAFLVLLTSNGVFLGVTWLANTRSRDLLEATALGLGAGIGFAFMLLAFAAIHERLRHASIPATLREAPIALITAGLMALAFMGFSGLIQE